MGVETADKRADNTGECLRHVGQASTDFW